MRELGDCEGRWRCDLGVGNNYCEGRLVIIRRLEGAAGEMTAGLGLGLGWLGCTGQVTSARGRGFKVGESVCRRDRVEADRGVGAADVLRRCYGLNTAGAPRPATLLGPAAQLVRPARWVRSSPLGTTALKGQPWNLLARVRYCVSACPVFYDLWVLLSFAPGTPGRAQEWRSAEFARESMPRQWQPGAASGLRRGQLLILLGLARYIISWMTCVDIRAGYESSMAQRIPAEAETSPYSVTGSLVTVGTQGTSPLRSKSPAPARTLTTCSGASEGGNYACDLAPSNHLDGMHRASAPRATPSHERPLRRRTELR